MCLKKTLRRDQLRQLMQMLLTDYRVSERRACRIVMVHRTVWPYKRKGEINNQVLRACIRDIAHTRVRYGMWRLLTLLRREGWPDNRKRVYRLYKLDELNLRSKQTTKCIFFDFPGSFRFVT